MATLYAGLVVEAALGGKRVRSDPRGSADGRSLEVLDDLPHLSGPAAAVRQVLAAAVEVLNDAMIGASDFARRRFLASQPAASTALHTDPP